MDPEKGYSGSTAQRVLSNDQKYAHTAVDGDDSPSSSQRGTILEYNATPVKQDGGVLSKLRNFEALMDRKLGIESEAIDRKLPEERKKMTWRDSMTMAALWASGTMNLSCFATGFLGWEFGLDLKQSILCCIFGSLLGAAVTGFCATLGAPTGLRQISVSRYSFGWWPNKLIALLNTIQQIGWSAVGCITGGVALNAVADGKLSIAVGIVIIAVLSMLVSFVGLKAILPYERYAWIVYLIIFLIIFGEVGHYADNKTTTDQTGKTLAGNVLSLIAVVYGSSASWATVASDYYVLYPVNTSRTKVFILTTLGICVPTSIGLVCGATVSSALNSRTDWSDTYTNQGIGFLIQDMLYPRGFAKFLLVLLVLSGINCNIINTYSAAISCQQFSRPFARIPRFIWTIACFCVILALALAGRNSLLAYLNNFLSLLGYWCTSYFVVVFTEHYLFRKGNVEYNYNLQGWNDPKQLPLGLAAGTAFLLGVVMWCLGMVETWFVGPIGKQIGADGGDIANEMTFLVTLAAYVPLRYLERKIIGR